MSKKVRVISGEIDGRELRREKLKDKFFVYCDGKKDDANINEALVSAAKGKVWSISSDS